MILRNIKKLKANKQSSIVQIAGMVLAVLVCIFIGLYAFNEYSYDEFHEDSDLIYRSQNTIAMLDGELSDDKLSYIDDFARMHPCYRGATVEAGANVFYENKVYFADGSLFSVFSFKIKDGNAIKALGVKNQLVISERYAKKYFGNENPIGKTMKINGAYEHDVSYTVGAVFYDLPFNSHVKFDILLSMENILVHDMYAASNPWRWSNFYTYFKTKKQINTEQLGYDVSFLANNNGALEHYGEAVAYEFYPLNKLHLNGQHNFMDNNSKASDVNMRLFLAFVILGIAWLNYINLSLGSALKSKLEIGVKKVMGASNFSLWSDIFQRILSVNLFVLAISVFAYLIITVFIDNIGISMSLLAIKDLIVFGACILLVLLLGVLLVSSAVYVLLNRFTLTELLSKQKKAVKAYQSPWIMLFVVQFSASIILISFAFVSTKQVNALMQVNTGMQINHILAIHSANTAKNGSISQDRSTFEQEVLKIPNVSASSSSSYIPGGAISSFMPTRLASKSREFNVASRINFIGYNYLPMLGHELIAGRNFSDAYTSDGKGTIINETLLKAYGFANAEDALGKEIYWETRDEKRIVIGVMKDFYQQSADRPIEPTMFQLWKHARGYCLLNMDTDNVAETMAEVEKLWAQIHPGNAFDYLWLDEHYNQQFTKWVEHSFMIKVFSAVALFIACMGLFGLSSMLMANRTKEIGVRKVNGAKISEIMTMLNVGFVKWVALAFVIATPIAYFVMSKWLQKFAYKTSLSWWIFALAGIVALGIALLTVSWQTYRAARRNPIEALRYE